MTDWTEIVKRLREQEVAYRSYHISGQDHKRHVNAYPTIVLALATAEQMAERKLIATTCPECQSLPCL